ncbi:MAG: heme-binding protein, partial [Pirellulales bacterium]
LEGRTLLSAAGIGTYDAANAQFLLRESTTPGPPEIAATFGFPNAKPVVGDFDNDGIDTIAIFDSIGQWGIRNENRTGPPDVGPFPYGAGSFEPVAGNWDGIDGDSVGVFDPATATWYLRNLNSSGPADFVPFSFGAPGFVPVVGDWNGDGVDTIGAFDPNTGIWYLRNSNDAGFADAGIFAFGGPNFKPVVADFDGLPNGDGIAVVSPQGQWYVRYTASPGNAEVNPFPYGGANSSVLAGVFGDPVDQLTSNDVDRLLAIAGQASKSDDAVIAIVDRNGEILGVRVESDVPISPADRAVYVSAIDGAIAKARTAAFFANDSAPIISSRTIRFISQSTVTEREVNSNPNTFDPVLRGPGTVAPIGLGGHFPPGVAFTPPVDLFAIEHTNRDSLIHPGADHLRGTADDIPLTTRFDIDPTYVAPGQEILAPESYAYEFNLEDPNFLPSAQARGIATLPGGIPLATIDSIGNQHVVGGIGVFFPGPNAYASYEQNYVAGYVQSENDRTNAPRVLEAEWIAYATSAAASGTLPPDLQSQFNTMGLDNSYFFPPVDILLRTRLDLVGITLEVIGPTPDGVRYTQPGLLTTLDVGRTVGQEATQVVDGSLDQVVDPNPATKYRAGNRVPEGWLVLPHGSMVDPLTGAQVQSIIEQGVAQANLTRAAIRLPAGAARTKMVFAVSDTEGNVLGLFRMPDATVFSIDVAVAKSRNTAYYADAAILQDIDVVDQFPGGPPLAKGIAFTNRTFRFLAEPRFPSGVEQSLAGQFSTMNDPGQAIDPRTGRPGAESSGPPVPYTDFQSVLGFDSFNHGTNFLDPDNIAHQNGIVFFPGSSPLYTNTTLIGGFGVSGDGVDQDDVVTFIGAKPYLPPAGVLRADQVFVRNVRLPYQKFLRNPEG